MLVLDVHSRFHWIADIPQQHSSQNTTLELSRDLTVVSSVQPPPWTARNTLGQIKQYSGCLYLIICHTQIYCVRFSGGGLHTHLKLYVDDYIVLVFRADADVKTESISILIYWVHFISSIQVQVTQLPVSLDALYIEYSKLPHLYNSTFERWWPGFWMLTITIHDWLLREHNSGHRLKFKYTLFVQKCRY